VKRAAIVAAVLCACDRRAAITSCDDDLRGRWRTETGQTWMILDGGDALEIYPLFPDVPGDASDLEVAPRVIDLRRTPAGISGELHRRYLRRAAICDAKVPARITACGDALDLVFADPAPPVGFAPCAWGRTNPSRRERWHRD
jgi:hypothetical protein